MPTPIGHTLAGLTVWAITRKPASLKEALSEESLGWAALCVVAANISDADFIMVSEDGVRLSGLYHHGITHS
ncbi:MAG: hypothetical protein OEZ04_12945, partial [Nitrospinota bacterium]|nr:hypothetical protein [Nitrospinota bacterium]